MTNSKNKGWVRLWRKIEDNPIWFLEPFTKAQAWIDLFLNANHTEGVIGIRGNIVTIERGQIGWSEVTMAKRWKWSKNKVRRYLKWLETEQQIVQQKDRYLTTIITILEYESYQNDTADDTAERQQTIHKQELKNDKNEIKNITNVMVKPDKRNPDINEVSKYFLEVFQIPKEDCTQKQSRQYWSLLLKESKTGVTGVRWLIDVAGSDEFYRNNITSSKDLYYKRVKIVSRKRGDKPKIAVMGGGEFV